jgi:hypothetical protein
MGRERSDLDIPEGTVWPATEARSEKDEQVPDVADGTTPIELGPGDQAPGDQPAGAQPPVSLDPDRDDAERNAASGGWDGANEQIENDFETEQLRRGQDASAGGAAGNEDTDGAEEDVPLA